jgi:hypothetical protein
VPRLMTRQKNAAVTVRFAASKQNCLRTAYVMSPTNDDIVEFARISGTLFAAFCMTMPHMADHANLIRAF